MPRGAPAGEKANGASQTLTRGLDVLEALIDGPLALGELSKQLGLARTTTHRLAAALVDRRVLTLRAREGYCLGPKLIELGNAASGQIQLTAIARPIIEELSADTGDAVHLGVLEGQRVLYLDKVPGIRRVSIVSRVGERQPIASTGLGKALVLDMDEKQWADYFPRDADGAQDAGLLKEWIQRMRFYAEGDYAFDLAENEDQIRCVAAQYMDDDRMHSLIPKVQDTAHRISYELGWSARVGRAKQP